MVAMLKWFNMRPPPDPPAAAPPETRERFRALPSVDELLARPALSTLAKTAGRGLVAQTTREILGAFRADLRGEGGAKLDHVTPGAIEARVLAAVESLLAPSLRRVVNATGVILHTNLGRAPLAAKTVAAIADLAGGYSNLEYDLARGERGKRDVHTSNLLASLIGAEGAMVVNNNAAAVFLVLNTLAKGAEVIVSRGELIEIGDGFRIPDIMSESGAILREVGTTNRTRIRDYERAIGEQSRLLLRVHPSNFRISGFTGRPSLDELVALGGRTGLPVYEDLGSGCLADLSNAGVLEPLASQSFAAGASIVSFSGDKLLGGPQAGIIAGRKEIVERLRRNPLFRALRVDKLTIAGLEATLQAYRRGAFDEIPALRMIRASAAQIAHRVTQFIERASHMLPEHAALEIVPGFSLIGGGSTPDQQLPTHLIAFRSRRHSAAVLEEGLRSAPSGVPVIARIESDRLVLDLRTVSPEEEAQLTSALVAVLSAPGHSGR